MYWQAKDIEAVARRVIKTYGDLNHLNDPQCRIAYQHCDKAKKDRGKIVLADTQLVNEKLKVFCCYDFIITVYDANCIGLDDVRMERLMYHELKHVGFEAPDRYYIIPHDLEDFRSVIDKWGTDWIRNDSQGT